MKYLLDTNQIIHYLRNSPETVEKLTPLFKEGTAVSVITVAEYLRGVYRSKNTKKDAEAFQEFLRVAQINILPIDAGIATLYAKLQANFEKKGAMVPHFDLLIASTAIKYSLALISCDKVFTRIKGLKLI